MELDALAEVETPGRWIGILPALGHERSLCEVRSPEIDELIEQMSLELDPDHAVVAIRIEAARIRRQRNLPLRLGLALCEDVRAREPEDGERAARRQDSAPPTMSHGNTAW